MHNNRAEALSVAIVGAGLVGSWHARAAMRAGARLIAIVDSDLERARLVAGRLPGCRAVTSLDDLDASAPPNVIHICTPTSTHERLTRASLAAGSHVLVEKPMAPTATLTAELLQLATDVRRIVCPVHQWLFQRGVRQILLRRDELGDLLHVRGLICSAGALSGSSADADTIVREILPHPLSLLERLVPGALARLHWVTARPRAGELNVLGRSENLTASLMVSMHGRPTANEMTFIGSRGTAHLDLFHGFAVIESGVVSRMKKIQRPFERAGAVFLSAGSNLARRAWARQFAYPGLWELVDGFYRAAAGAAPPPIAKAEVMAVAQALDTIDELAFQHASSSSNADSAGSR